MSIARVTAALAFAILTAASGLAAQITLSADFSSHYTTLGGEDADDVPDTDYQHTGIRVGAVFTIPFATHGSVQIGAAISTRRYEWEPPLQFPGAFTIPRTTSAGYLEVPLLVRVGLPLGDAAVVPELTAGLAPSFLVPCSDDGSSSNSCDAGRDDLKTFGVTAMVGAGLEFQVFDGPTGFTTGFAYSLGLLPFHSSRELTHRAFSLSIGMRRHLMLH